MNIILFEQREIVAGRVSLPLRDRRAVHLLKVLHKKEGASFEAGVIGGPCGEGVIIEESGGCLLIALDLQRDPPPRLEITLGVGFVRQIQLRRILKESANFGVERLAFFGTDLGDKNYERTTLFTDGGAERAMLEGIEEARDTRLPALSLYKTLDDWIAQLESGIPRAALHLGGYPLLETGGGSRIALAIGSERGFSEREVDTLLDNDFALRSLGTRALRTESACIAALGRRVCIDKK